VMGFHISGVEPLDFTTRERVSYLDLRKIDCEDELWIKLSQIVSSGWL
jgi:hypothetical protein